MADYAAASRTKDHYESELLSQHPEIVSMAPRKPSRVGWRPFTSLRAILWESKRGRS